MVGTPRYPYNHHEAQLRSSMCKNLLYKDEKTGNVSIVSLAAHMFDACQSMFWACKRGKHTWKNEDLGICNVIRRYYILDFTSNLPDRQGNEREVADSDFENEMQMLLKPWYLLHTVIRWISQWWPSLSRTFQPIQQAAVVIRQSNGREMSDSAWKDWVDPASQRGHVKIRTRALLLSSWLHRPCHPDALVLVPVPRSFAREHDIIRELHTLVRALRRERILPAP